MRAIISVVGKDRPGILAYVANRCADHKVNIVDITQTVLQEMFTMIMIVEIEPDVFESFVDIIEQDSKLEGLAVHVMHEDIFNAMHNI